MFDMDKADRECEEMLHGEEKPLHPDTVHMTFEKPLKAVSQKKTTTTTHTEKTNQKDTHKPTHNFEKGKWDPVKPAPNWMDKLKSCVIWAAGFGALCLLFFYWQQTGQMASSAAVPSMCVCTALAGYGIGKNATSGNR